MDPALLRIAETRIRERVDAVYTDPTGKAEAIYDGIINLDLYCSANPRIMWILKEPWDEADCSGGGWSMCSDLLAKKPLASLSQATFHPIVYIAYGLFNGIDAFEDMPWIRDMDDPEGVLRRLAFVNAKKLPGVTRGASPAVVMEWFQRGKGIIKEQISAYSPEIVFGCSPHMPTLLDDRLKGSRDKKQSVGSADFVWHDGILFVHVYHPGQTQITRETYVDDAGRFRNTT